MGYSGPVILMVPERTTHEVSRMHLNTVHTSRGVDAWKPFPSQRNRRICLRRTLITLRQGLMMILGVGAMAQRTKWVQKETGRLWVIPESASGTERNTRVHTSRGDCLGHPCHGDGTVGEMTRPGTRLEIPDIKVNAACISPSRIMNDMGRGYKPDEV